MPTFPDDIFKCVFLKDCILMLIQNSLGITPEGPVANMAMRQH